jgi:hypothetical protein
MSRLIFILILCSSAIIAASAQAPQKLVDNSKWSGLPQEPVAEKQHSDLEDDRIKGKVKTITYMTLRHRAGMPDGDKKLGRIEEYNEQGNKVVTKWIRDGVVASAIFYGYVDGERAQKSEGLSGGSGNGSIDTRPSDPRFDFKSRYKYKDGKLSEVVSISNRNKVWMTRKWVYTAQSIESLVFSENGKLNQKYLHRFDEKGNEIGFESFDVFKDPNKVTLRSKYTYGAFDAIGNWTERTGSYSSTKDGQELYQPYETTFRTISYYK